MYKKIDIQKDGNPKKEGWFITEFGQTEFVKDIWIKYINSKVNFVNPIYYFLEVPDPTELIKMCKQNLQNFLKGGNKHGVIFIGIEYTLQKIDEFLKK